MGPSNWRLLVTALDQQFINQLWKQTHFGMNSNFKAFLASGKKNKNKTWWRRRLKKKNKKRNKKGSKTLKKKKIKYHVKTGVGKRSSNCNSHVISAGGRRHFLGFVDYKTPNCHKKVGRVLSFIPIHCAGKGIPRGSVTTPSCKFFMSCASQRFVVVSSFKTVAKVLSFSWSGRHCLNASRALGEKSGM